MNPEGLIDDVEPKLNLSDCLFFFFCVTCLRRSEKFLNTCHEHVQFLRLIYDVDFATSRDQRERSSFGSLVGVLEQC